MPTPPRSATTVLPARVRAARVAVAALFVTNGIMLANLVPWYPVIQDDLGLNNVLLGVAIAGYPTGALVLGIASGQLIGRFGSAPTSIVAGGVTAAMLPIVGVAPSFPLLALAMVVTGGGDAVMDAAMNAHGLRVQRRYGRSIINGFHALWSAGAVVGGLVGTGAIALGLPRGLHLAGVGVVVIVVLAVVRRRLLAGPEDGERSDAADPEHAGGLWSAWRAAGLVILGLGAMLIAGTAVEDSAATWSGVFLDNVVRAPAGVLGLGFVAAQVCMFAGRITGDRLVDRFGPVVMARTGLALSALGLLVVVLGREVASVVVGFGISGFGVATIYPLAMTAAGDIPGVRSGDGVTLVTWLGRIGFLAMPPLVGAVADATSLPLALGVVVAAALVGSLIAPLLRPTTSDAPT